MEMFKKIVIVGVGLIGGSIGLAVKKKKLAREVVGLCRRELSAKKAIKAKAVDSVSCDFKEAFKGADFAVVCTPVGMIVESVKKAMDSASPGLIITDAGSTKEKIVSTIEKHVPLSVRFVGSHPMAGSEKSGVEYSSPCLFENSVCIVTKTKNTDLRALKTVIDFWQALGAKCLVLSPSEHDRHVAHVSHLPHAAAYALSYVTDRRSLQFAANGFRDTTRIAASDPYLWKDIFLTNKKAVLSSVRAYERALKQFEKALAAENGPALIKFLEKAKKLRDEFLRIG